MSTLCSRAILRTSGEERDLCRSLCGASTPAAWATAVNSDAAGRGERRGGCRPAARARLDRHSASTSPPIVATTLLTGDGLALLARVISLSTPAAGDGISASTLSVEISKSGSSRSTASPTFLIQRTIVPSAIDSPICGISTGVDIARQVNPSGQGLEGASAP